MDELNEPSNRIFWLDQLKAVSMYIVILGHSLLKFKKQGLFKFIYSFHMPLFFMISGFTFRPEKYDRIKDCIKDKIIKLVYPYILLNIVVLPLWYINMKTDMISYDSPLSLTAGILYSNSSVLRAPSNATWFLMTLFLAEIIYFVLYRFFKTDKSVFTMSCVVALIGVLAPLGKEVLDAPLHFDVSLVAQFYYGCGYMLKKNFAYFKNLFKEYKKIKLFSVFMIGALFSFLNKQVDMSNELYRNFTYTLISSLTLSIFLFYIIQSINHVSKFLLYIGQNTIIILAFHIPVLRVLQAAFPIFLKGQFYAILASLIILLCMIPIIWIINRYFQFIIKMPVSLKKMINKI